MWFRIPGEVGEDAEYAEYGEAGSLQPYFGPALPLFSLAFCSIASSNSQF
jgi:hypothetical protein